MEPPARVLPTSVQARRADEPLRDISVKHFVPFEAELAVAGLVGSYLSAWALTFSCLAGDWSFLDGFYFCIVTLTTVGYGDLTPCDTVLCRVLGIVFIWTNVLIVSAVLGIVGVRVERAVARMGRIAKVSQLTVHFAGLGAFIAVLAVGFSHQEGRSFVDGLYFSTVTLTTVGYGAFAPSKEARWLMCPMLLIGVVSVASIAGYFASVAEKHVKQQVKSFSKPTRAAMSVLFLFLFAFIGGFAFKLVGGEEWSINDAIYFALVTMTTVGFGDMAPVTTGVQKLLAILFVWFSITLLAVLFGFISAEAEQLEEYFVDAKAKRKSTRRRAASLLFLLHLSCAALFMVIESWSLLDSIYFTSVTLSTVGYGDITPKSDLGKLVTSCLVLTGVPSTAVLVHSLSGGFSSRLVRKIEELDD